MNKTDGVDLHEGTKRSLPAAGMSMRQPATRWQDACPVGNGTVGAMLYGQLARERVLLNHEHFYAPTQRLPEIDVSDRLADVRRAIAEGREREAESLMPDAYAERGGDSAKSTNSGRDPYQPLGDVCIEQTLQGAFREYRRGVDFATGLAWTTWRDAGNPMRRELFVSRADDTVYLRLRSEHAGGLCCRISLEPGGSEGSAKGWFGDQAAAPVSYRTVVDDHGLALVGEYAGGFAFGAVLRAECRGGSFQCEDGALRIADADEVVVRVRVFVKEDPEAAVARLQAELAEASTDFDSALAIHAALHGELFNRMRLHLAGGDPSVSNDELLMQAYEGDVPAGLCQRLFDYGRYLLVCSSRPGGWPANLQGIWNGDTAPAWNSDFHTDENVQMNYWAALSGNLRETMLPFFDYFETWLDDYRRNARHLFGCRGIFVPIAQTTHGLDRPAVWSNWTAAAGWLAQHFYDYWLFTGDRQFLAERAVPWMKETALFYEDFLVEDASGRLCFCPSLSPENKPAGKNSLLTMNATMDVAICREVLTNLCAACELLELEPDGVARWRDMLERLPAYAVNEDGAMREWLHPDYRDNYHHRHQSHIYPLFPGLEVTTEENPELYEACRVAVEKRLVVGLTSQTGWSMAHMANIYARLGMGDRALECIELLTRSSMGPNLLTYHNDWRHMGLSLAWNRQPPFQIDANFGMTAAVLEMLVFSKPGLIKLLPALPQRWPAGRADGIVARGGVTVDLDWDVSAARFAARLCAGNDGSVVVKVPSWVDTITCSGAAAEPSKHHGAGYWKLALLANHPARIASVTDDR